MSEEDPAPNEIENTKKRRISSILKSRIGDGDTTTYVGMPAVVPVLEKKGRRVSFADADDIRLFKAAISDVDPAQNVASEYSMVKRGVLTDRTDLMQSNVVAKTKSQPVAGPGQRLIGSTQHQSSDASDVRTTMFSTNIKMFMPTPHEASEDLDRSRIFMGDDSDREDSNDGSQFAAESEEDAMTGNRTRIGCEGMDLTAVFEIGNVTRTASGNRTVIGSCDMEMTRVCDREELEFPDIGSDMNRTRILGDNMEVSVCVVGTKSFIEDDCKKYEKSLAGQPQLRHCQTGLQSSKMKVLGDRTVIAPEEMNLTECLPADFQLNATALLKDVAKDSGSQACEQLDVTKVFLNHDACLEETRCFDSTIHLNDYMQNTNVQNCDMNLTQCRGGWDTAATMVFDQSAAMNETTAQSSLAVSNRSSANLVDAKAFLSMLDCPPSSSVGSSSKTDAKSFLSMLTAGQGKASVETKQQQQRNEEAVAIDKDPEVDCRGNFSVAGVQQTVYGASASSNTTGSTAPEIVIPAMTHVQENLASSPEASIVPKKVEGCSATCRKPMIKADKRLPNVDDMLKSLHVSHAKKPRLSTNSEPVIRLGDSAANVDCQNDLEFAASVPNCQTDYTESGFQNWKENTSIHTIELNRSIGFKSCKNGGAASFLDQVDPVMNASRIVPASENSYHSVLLSVNETAIIDHSESAELTEKNVTALNVTELPVLNNLSTLLGGTMEESVASGLGYVVGSAAKVGVHDHEPTLIYEDSRFIRTVDQESMNCSQTVMTKAISDEHMKPEEALSVYGNVSMPSVSILEADVSGPLSHSTAEAVFASFPIDAADSPPKPNLRSDDSVTCDRSAILNRTAAKFESTSAQISKLHEETNATHMASFDLTHVTVDGRASVACKVNTTRAQNSFLSGSFSAQIGAASNHHSVCSAAVTAASVTTNLERSCNSFNRTVTNIGNVDYSLNESVETAAAAAANAVTYAESASSLMGYVDGLSVTRANATGAERGKKSLRKSSLASSLADESFPEVELSIGETSNVKHSGCISSNIQDEPFAGDVSQPSFDYEDLAKKLSSLDKFFDDLDAKLQSEMDAMMLQQMEQSRIEAERQELLNKLSTATQLLSKLELERAQVLGKTEEFLKMRRDAESRFAQRQREVAIMSKKLVDEEMWLKRLVAWTMIDWDWETGCSFTFLDGSLSLVVKFGDVVEGKIFLSRPVRTVEDIKLHTAETENDAWTIPLLNLAHRLLFESVSVESLRQQFKLMTDLPEILRLVSFAAIVAKRVTDDLNRLDYYTGGENVEIDGSRISVVFFNVRAFTKFRLSCEIHLSSFLTSAPSWTFTNLIGDLSETDVMKVVGTIQPGMYYLYNLQKAIQQYFKSCKPHVFH